jgi:hypothetical protein
MVVVQAGSERDSGTRFLTMWAELRAARAVVVHTKVVGKNEGGAIAREGGFPTEREKRRGRGKGNEERRRREGGKERRSTR